MLWLFFFFFFKQKTAYEMRISDWSSDVCSSDLGGWIAFNIKETFLGESDSSGFALFVKHLIAGEFMQLHHLERYRHRISIEGNPLYYYAVIGRKLAPLREEWPPPRGPGVGVVVGCSQRRSWKRERKRPPEGGRSEEHTSALQSLMRISYA